MKRSRAIRFAVCCGLGPAALGCAQIAGLTNDYRLAAAGAGGASGSASGGVGADGGGVGASGGSGAAGGASPAGGSAGTDGGAAPTAGAAGANGGAAGTSVGVAGSSGSSGASSGGSSGASGAGGGAGAGPLRIGFSEFHDSASGGDNASSHLTAATFAKPANTATGDLMLVFFGADHNLSNVSGSELSAVGWTLLDQHEGYGTDGQASYLMYKFVSATEPDPIVFSGINPAGSGNGVQGLLSVYRGVNPSTPVNAYEVNVVATGQTVAQVSTATPAITTTTANCLLIAGLSPDSAVDAPVVTSWPQGFVESHVSVNNPANPYPYGWANIYSAERHLAAAGTVPASAFGWTIVSGSQYYGSLAFVLALAP